MRDESGAPVAYDEYTGWSTPGIGDGQVNSQSADWGAGAVQPAASDWGDVLKYGFARLVDAKVRPLRSDNTAPVPQRQAAAPTPNAAGPRSVGLWVAGALGVAALLFLATRSRSA